VLLASHAGRVEALVVDEGEQVAAGALIAELAEA
jgi:biotin carboxyl carrier protein